MDSHVTITSLPVSGADRTALIEEANTAFERILERIEPQNEELTRSLWDAGHYIDHHLVTMDMLPMSRADTAYYIDAFLVHHVIALAVEADRLINIPLDVN